MILNDVLTPQWPLGLEPGLGVGLNAKFFWNITLFCMCHVAQIHTQLPAVRVCLSVYVQDGAEDGSLVASSEKTAVFRMFFFFFFFFYVLDVVSITVYDRDRLLNIGSSVAQCKLDFEFLNAGGLFTDTTSEPFVYTARPVRWPRWRKHGHLDQVDWDMFRAASDDDVEAYSDSVTCFIRKCIEDVVPTKTIPIYPNQKPWINCDVQSALSARTSAFKSGNTDDRKQASYDLRRSIKAAKWQYRNKVEDQFNTNNPRSMWQGINNITGFKGNKPATVNIPASLPDELNTFYARFEADTTAHTESAPAAAAEEVSPLSLSVADVKRSFKWVNIRKAVGLDGIPGRVLKACAFQLAGVFTDIFNRPLFSVCGSTCFKKSTICPYRRK